MSPIKDPLLERQILQVQLERFGPWFYRMDLGHGLTTPAAASWIMEASEARRQMIAPVLERTFRGRWSEVTCLDVACGEGFYTSYLAGMEPRSVLALDARAANVEKARFVMRCQGWPNVRVDVRDVYDVTPESTGVFDLCLCLGLLYHLEDPMYVLRRLRSVTRELCVIDTQVTQAATVAFGWLTADRRESTDCILAMHEEPDAEWNRSASTTGISLIPSEPALRTMLLHAGFRKLEKLAPPKSAFDAFETGDRVVLLAWV